MSQATNLGNLALFGGSPAFPRDQLTPWPAPDEEHREALIRVLESRRYHRVNHPIVVDLERTLEAWGGTHARALASGTAALHVSFDYLREPEGRVAVSALNWPGAVGPVFFSGMEPVYHDVSLETACLDGSTIKADDRGSSIVAVLATHLFGNYCGVAESLTQSPATSAMPIVHDCAQAIGALTSLHMLPSEAGIALSGNGSKHLGAGELGILCSRDAGRIEHVDRVSLASSSRDGGRIFSPNTCGYNYRPNVFSASIAVSRMKTIDAQLAQRRKNAAHVWRHLSELPGIRRVFELDEERNSFCVIPLRFDLAALGLPSTSQVRDRLVEVLQAEGAPVGVWLRRPVWEYMAQSTAHPMQKFPNTECLLRTMFHIAEIGPPNGLAQMSGIASAFEKVWNHIDGLRTWLTEVSEGDAS